MAYYPASAAALNAITYPAGPTATGTTITASGSTNTKGSYTELISSTPFACNRVIVEICFASTGGRRHLLDLAIGAAAAETDIVSNLVVEGCSGAGQTTHGILTLPCSIPAGTRIAARMQSSVGSSTINLAITLLAAGDTPGPASYTTYGANTADSGGVTIDPGVSINTKGAYSEITPSTSAVAQILAITFGFGGNSLPTAANWAVDLATGGAGSETVLVPDLRITAHTTQTPSPWSYTLLTYIPAGTRIAMRASCSSGDATDRLLDVAIHTAVAPAESGDGGMNWAPISLLGAAAGSLIRAVASGMAAGRG